MGNEPRELPPVERIAVRPLGGDRDSISLMPPSEVLYAFLGAAALPELAALAIRQRCPLDSRRVYLRTARGVYWTRYRCLSQLRHALGPLAEQTFLPVSRGRLVNTLKISGLDFGGRPPLIIFNIGE